MPDVFQVLKADHDEVKVMLSKLENGPKAGGGGAAGQPAPGLAAAQSPAGTAFPLPPSM
jgi:hypothetical protein